MAIGGGRKREKAEVRDGEESVIGLEFILELEFILALIFEESIE